MSQERSCDRSGDSFLSVKCLFSPYLDFWFRNEEKRPSSEAGQRLHITWLNIILIYECVHFLSLGTEPLNLSAKLALTFTHQYVLCFPCDFEPILAISRSAAIRRAYLITHRNVNITLRWRDKHRVTLYCPLSHAERVRLFCRHLCGSTCKQRSLSLGSILFF